MVLFGVLAHNAPACFEDLIESINEYAPDAEIILFDGGRDSELRKRASALNVEICKYSKPLRHEKVVGFHFGLMKQIHEERKEYDYLVTLDSDMLLVRHGFEEFLQEAMRGCGYMSTNFCISGGGSEFSDWWLGKCFAYQWNQWSAYFPSGRLAGCFNPGQIFRKELVDQIMGYAKLDEILSLVERSRFPYLEELILPSFALSLDSNPKKNPGSRGIKLETHNADSLAAFTKDESVFMVHKVTMDYDAKDRQFLRSIRRGKVPEYFAETMKEAAVRKLKQVTVRKLYPLKRLVKAMYYKRMINN